MNSDILQTGFAIHPDSHFNAGRTKFKVNRRKFAANVCQNAFT